MSPRRVQLSRRPGARLDGAVKVDRSTRWGNPHTLGPDRCQGCQATGRFAVHSRDGGIRAYREDLVAGRRIVPSQKRPDRAHTINDVRRELAGKDLACWCPLDQSCHAAVLLEIANGKEAATGA